MGIADSKFENLNPSPTAQSRFAKDGHACPPEFSGEVYYIAAPCSSSLRSCADVKRDFAWTPNAPAINTTTATEYGGCCYGT